MGADLVALYCWPGCRELSGCLPLLLGDRLQPLEDHQLWYTARSTRTKKVGPPTVGEQLLLVLFVLFVDALLIKALCCSMAYILFDNVSLVLARIS